MIANPKTGRWVSFLVTFAILAFMVAASGSLPGSAAYATPLTSCSTSSAPCLIGPNLEIVSLTGTLSEGLFACVGGTTTFNSSPTNPSYSTTGIPTCNPMSSSASEAVTFQALNGFLIDEVSGFYDCGVTGLDSLTIVTSFSGSTTSFSCPTGSASMVPFDFKFAPVSSLSGTVTITNEFFLGGSSILAATQTNFSLVTPESGAFGLLLSGAAALAILSGARGRIL